MLVLLPLLGPFTKRSRWASFCGLVLKDGQDTQKPAPDYRDSIKVKKQYCRGLNC